jgi:hypothetical protein
MLMALQLQMFKWLKWAWQQNILCGATKFCCNWAFMFKLQEKVKLSL